MRGFKPIKSKTNKTPKRSSVDQFKRNSSIIASTAAQLGTLVITSQLGEKEYNEEKLIHFLTSPKVIRNVVVQYGLPRSQTAKLANQVIAGMRNERNVKPF